MKKGVITLLYALKRVVIVHLKSPNMSGVVIASPKWQFPQCNAGLFRYEHPASIQKTVTKPKKVFTFV